MKSNHIIRGIKSIDHNIKNPAKIEIENGGIGAKQVTLTVTAPKGTGMGTEFYFYGEEVANVSEYIKIISFNSKQSDLKFKKKTIHQFIGTSRGKPIETTINERKCIFRSKSARRKTKKCWKK